MSRFRKDTFLLTPNFAIIFAKVGSSAEVSSPIFTEVCPPVKASSPIKAKLFMPRGQNHIILAPNYSETCPLTPPPAPQWIFMPKLVPTSLESISSTFYLRVFCRYFGAKKLQSQCFCCVIFGPKISYKKPTRKMLVKLTASAGQS